MAEDAGLSFRLDGRRVLLTGAAGTIGSALAKGFAEAGADVLLVDRSAECLAEVADDVAARFPGARVDGRVLDITSDPDLWDASFRTNVLAPYALAQRFCPGMRERGRGNIINVVSGSGLLPTKGLLPMVRRRPPCG